jgi:hypothetical protein
MREESTREREGSVTATAAAEAGTKRNTLVRNEAQTGAKYTSNGGCQTDSRYGMRPRGLHIMGRNEHRRTAVTRYLRPNYMEPVECF